MTIRSGHYYGVGMQVAPRNGKTIVVAPFGGSPAYKAGLRPGDVILEVNDKKTDSLTTTEVADLLKGPRATHVQVTVGREGSDKPITFDIVRDEISRNSVEDAFWVRPGIMYMKVSQFNENTSQEMEDNFKRLGENNVKGLVLICERIRAGFSMKVSRWLGIICARAKWWFPIADELPLKSPIWRAAVQPVRITPSWFW